MICFVDGILYTFVIDSSVPLENKTYSDSLQVAICLERDSPEASAFVSAPSENRHTINCEMDIIAVVDEDFRRG